MERRATSVAPHPRPRPAIALTVALLVLGTCAGCAARQPVPSPDAPLAGRFWDVKARAWVDEAKVAAAVAGAHFVYLGETHDNPEHHRLQARMLKAVVDAGRRPAVAFEMLDVDEQAKVDASLASAPHDPDALGAAVRWNESGWPPFALYRPIFEVALDAGLPIVATNLSRTRIRSVISKGVSVLEPNVRALLERAGPLSPAAEREIRDEMAASHCGELPETMLDPFVQMQRARDAEIATHLLDAGRERGAVLIAGAGHVRTDRGVPSYVALEAPSRSRVAVGFLEIAEGQPSLDAYAERFSRESFPFDFIGFTVAQEREDPCRGIEKHIHPIRPEPKDATWVWRVDAPAKR